MIKSMLELDGNTLADMRESRVILYDLYPATQCTLMFLAEQHIYVEGFWLPQPNPSLKNFRYLNKRMFFDEDMASLEASSYAVLDIFGIHAQRIRTKTPVPVFSLYKLMPSGRKLFFYGSGGTAVDAKNILQGTDDWEIVELTPNDTSPLDNLPPNGEKYDVVLANPNDTPASDKFSAHPRIRDCYALTIESLNGICFGRPSLYSVSLNMFVSTICNVYIQLHEDKRHIYWRKSKEFLLETVAQMRLFGINPAYVISDDGFVGTVGDVEFKTPYDLMYEETDHIRIWVWPESFAAAREFNQTANISERIICIADNLPANIHSRFCFDPNIGYNKVFPTGESFLTINTSGTKKPRKKIAVLGGSTTDARNFAIKSWPEYLGDILSHNHIAATVLAGGIGGYCVSQELIKLVRDIIPQQPDIVVSYSGVNELLSPAANSNFVHSYQEKLFQTVCGIKSQAFNMGSSEMEPVICGNTGRRDCAEHWLNTERMMYAICREYGIRFYAIAQPDLLIKKNMSAYDLELIKCMEIHCWGNFPRQKEYMLSLRALVEKSTQIYPWLIDFTHLFDEVYECLYIDRAHLTERGNELLAQAVFNLISAGITET